MEIIDLAQAENNIRRDEKIRSGINYTIDFLKRQLADNRKLPFLSLNTAKINLLFGEVMHVYNANMQLEENKNSLFLEIIPEVLKKVLKDQLNMELRVYRERAIQDGKCAPEQSFEEWKNEHYEKPIRTWNSIGYMPLILPLNYAHISEKQLEILIFLLNSNLRRGKMNIARRSWSINMVNYLLR